MVPGSGNPVPAVIDSAHVFPQTAGAGASPAEVNRIVQKYNPSAATSVSLSPDLPAAAVLAAKAIKHAGKADKAARKVVYKDARATWTCSRT